MDKRGQLYIISALLVAFALFIIISPTNIIKQTVTETNFYDLARNFEKESARFLNYLVESNPRDVSADFLNFTVLFTSYAKTKNQNAGFIFSFVKDDILYVGNYDTSNATFDMAGIAAPIIIPGCQQAIQAETSALGLTFLLSNLNRSTFAACMANATIFSSTQPPYLLTLIIQDGPSTATLKTELEPNHPDLIIVAREASGTITKVYLTGELLTP